jgi:predicted helicase
MQLFSGIPVQYAGVGEKKLVKLHIDYENVEPYKGNIDYKNPNPSYELQG